jgi:hypothetical protein
LYYLLALVTLFATLMLTTANGRASSGASFPMAGGIGLAITMGMIGGLLHAASAACVALRDIARNSFNTR